MRELRTRQEISDWMTAELHKHPECGQATVSVQYQLQEPRPDGCNWSDDLVVNFGEDDQEDVVGRIRAIVREARRLFNVSES